MATIDIGNIIRAYNVYSPKDIKADEITMLNLLERAKSIIKRKQASHAYLSMHKTNLQKNPFSPNSALEKIQESERAHIFLEDVAEAYFLNPIVQEDGTLLRACSTPTLINGKYLFLLVFSNDKEHASKIAPSVASRIINAVRITHGIKAAEMPVYKCFFDTEKNISSVKSGDFPIYIAGNDPSDDISALSNFGINKVDVLPMNPDADILFNRAIKETDPETKFLFLWLCFESIVPSQDRRNLFEVELSSEINNAEVFRLFKLRCELTHEGRSKVTTFDCLSVLWAIRIAICPQKDIQSIMSKSYEEWISSKNFDLPIIPNVKRLEANYEKTNNVFNKLHDLKRHLGKDSSEVIEHAITTLWKDTLPDD